MLKVAVIGAGVISDSHFEGWKNIPSIEVTAVVDLNEDAAKEKSDKWKIPNVVTDYKKVLNDESIDIVDLCIPHHLHADITIECLKADKHVICEKPIALTIEDAERVAAAEKETNKKLMIAENWYYIPSIAEGIKVVKEGKIGEVFSVKANLDFNGLRSKVQKGSGSRDNSWRGEIEKSGGGILMDAGIHSISVMRHLGGEAESIIGLIGQSVQEQSESIDNLFNTLIKFENGGTGYSHSTEASGWNMPKFDFEILGTNGAVFIDIIKQKLVTHINEEVKEQEIQAKGGMTEELEHFVECIENDLTPMSGSEDQIKSLKLILAAYQSAKEGGKPVMVN